MKKQKLSTSPNRGDYIKYENNQITYMRDGYIHRDERDTDGTTLPAMIKYDPYTGNSIIRYWYHKGFLHRDESEGPAIVGSNLVWYNRGSVHRDNGPAVIYSNGMKIWYQRNLMHREDGPAVIGSNFTDYYLFGRKLREIIHKKIMRIITCKQQLVRRKYISKIHTLLGNKICDDLKNIVIKYLINN